MCLSSLNRDVEIHQNTGWKLFGKSEEKEIYHTPIYDCLKDYIPGEWYESENKPLETTVTKECYTGGFHIFLNYEDAVTFRIFGLFNKYDYRIMKVDFEEVLAKGEQIGTACIVARRMKICV